LEGKKIKKTPSTQSQRLGGGGRRAKTGEEFASTIWGKIVPKDIVLSQVGRPVVMTKLKKKGFVNLNWGRRRTQTLYTKKVTAPAGVD